MNKTHRYLLFLSAAGCLSQRCRVWSSFVIHSYSTLPLLELDTLIMNTCLEWQPLGLGMDLHSVLFSVSDLWQSHEINMGQVQVFRYDCMHIDYLYALIYAYMYRLYTVATRWIVSCIWWYKYDRSTKSWWVDSPNRIGDQVDGGWSNGGRPGVSSSQWPRPMGRCVEVFQTKHAHTCILTYTLSLVSATCLFYLDTYSMVNARQMYSMFIAFTLCDCLQVHGYQVVRIDLALRLRGSEARDQ